jgi:hypothetical protein
MNAGESSGTMQTERVDHGWAAGPRRRIGLTAAVAIVAGGGVGLLLGRLIERTVLPGATFAVVALAIVGVATGVLYATVLAVRERDELGEDD